MTGPTQSEEKPRQDGSIAPSEDAPQGQAHKQSVAAESGLAPSPPSFVLTWEMRRELIRERMTEWISSFVGTGSELVAGFLMALLMLLLSPLIVLVGAFVFAAHGVEFLTRYALSMTKGHLLADRQTQLAEDLAQVYGLEPLAPMSGTPTWHVWEGRIKSCSVRLQQGRNRHGAHLYLSFWVTSVDVFLKALLAFPHLARRGVPYRDRESFQVGAIDISDRFADWLVGAKVSLVAEQQLLSSQGWALICPHYDWRRFGVSFVCTNTTIRLEELIEAVEIMSAAVEQWEAMPVGEVGQSESLLDLLASLATRKRLAAHWHKVHGGLIPIERVPAFRVAGSSRPRFSYSEDILRAQAAWEESFGCFHEPYLWIEQFFPESSLMWIVLDELREEPIAFDTLYSFLHLRADFNWVIPPSSQTEYDDSFGLISEHLQTRALVFCQQSPVPSLRWLGVFFDPLLIPQELERLMNHNMAHRPWFCEEHLSIRTSKRSLSAHEWRVLLAQLGRWIDHELEASVPDTRVISHMLRLARLGWLCCPDDALRLFSLVLLDAEGKPLHRNEARFRRLQSEALSLMGLTLQENALPLLRMFGSRFFEKPIREAALDSLRRIETKGDSHDREGGLSISKASEAGAVSVSKRAGGVSLEE